MKQIIVEVSDELADQLKPYQEEWAQILKLGLGQVKSDQSERDDLSRNRVIELLQEKGLAKPLDESLARRYAPGLRSHVRSRPIEAGGQPASKWIVEHRARK